MDFHISSVTLGMYKYCYSNIGAIYAQYSVDYSDETDLMTEYLTSPCYCSVVNLIFSQRQTGGVRGACAKMHSA